LIRINKIRIYKTLINELINEENMFDLYDLKKLEENLKTFEIEGEKDIYIFRGNKKYIISSSIFFITILFIVLNSIYKTVLGAEKITILKIVLILVLLFYVLFAFISLIRYKIFIKDKEIISGKLKINMDRIKTAIVKIDKVKGNRYDRYLEIISDDNRMIKLRLNIDNYLLFLKIIQNNIKEKFIIKN
jgi:hypothetical protein